MIPYTGRIFALEGLGQITEYIKQVFKKYTTRIWIIEGMVLTMLRFQIETIQQVWKKLKSTFLKCFRYDHPRNVRLSEAPSYGEKPL